MTLKVMDHLFDVKLELYFICEVDSALHNFLTYERGYDRADPLRLPHVFLTRLSLDQGLIGKSRVLWERIMNLIYFLEMGQELEASKRSKRAKFFRIVGSQDRWLFLEPYEKVIETYDSSYRTPEYHKSSLLRAELLGGAPVDPNALLSHLNRALNTIWENLLAIVSGGMALSFSDLHIDETGRIDPRYLRLLPVFFPQTPNPRGL